MRTFSAMDGEILADAARSGARCGSTACVALQLGADLYVAHAGARAPAPWSGCVARGPPAPRGGGAVCMQQSAGLADLPLGVPAERCKLYRGMRAPRRLLWFQTEPGVSPACLVSECSPTELGTATAGDSIAVLDRNGHPEVLTSKGSHKVTPAVLRCLNRSTQLPGVQNLLPYACVDPFRDAQCPLAGPGQQ
jgi:hypothetical protein